MEDAIIIPRRLLDSGFFRRGTETELSAFIDLLLMAEKEDRIVDLNGRKIEVHRGEICVSESGLSERWGWNRRRVAKYLRFLKMHNCLHNCLHNCSNRVTSLLSIDNYDAYMGGCTTACTTDCTTDPIPTDSAKIPQNLKNSKEILLANSKPNLFIQETLFTDSKLISDNKPGIEKEKNTKKKNDFSEAVERLYKLYPTKTARYDGEHSTGKCSADKARIERLLRSHTEEQIERSIRGYIKDTGGKFMKNFSTFLNNLPEYDEEEIEKPKVEDHAAAARRQTAKLIAEMQRIEEESKHAQEG